MNGLQANQILKSAQDVNQNFGILKRCTGCKEKKIIEEFYYNKTAKDGHASRCKKCLKREALLLRNKNPEKDRKKVRLWRKNNPEKAREGYRSWRKANVGKARKAAQRWRNNNPDKVRFWVKNNPEKIKAMWQRWYKKRQSTPQGRLTQNISNAIRKSLHDNKKGRHWEDLIGYTLDQLKKHIEKQFKPGMTWENYGEWHLDHKIPISAFNFEKSEDADFQSCWALKNLQPLWAKDNLKKNNKLKKPFQPSLIFK